MPDRMEKETENRLFFLARDGDNPISEEEILNIFFSEIDSIMKNFEYVFNYCGTSFKDAGIDL